MTYYETSIAACIVILHTHRFFYIWFSQNNNQIPIEGLPDPSQVIRSGSTHEFSGHFDEGDIPVTPALIPNAQNQIESDTTGGAQYKMDNATGFVRK